MQTGFIVVFTDTHIYMYTCTLVTLRYKGAENFLPVKPFCVSEYETEYLCTFFFVFVAFVAFVVLVTSE